MGDVGEVLESVLDEVRWRFGCRQERWEVLGCRGEDVDPEECGRPGSRERVTGVVCGLLDALDVFAESVATTMVW